MRWPLSTQPSGNLSLPRLSKMPVHLLGSTLSPSLALLEALNLLLPHLDCCEESLLHLFKLLGPLGEPSPCLSLLLQLLDLSRIEFQTPIVLELDQAAYFLSASYRRPFALSPTIRLIAVSLQTSW